MILPVFGFYSREGSIIANISLGFDVEDKDTELLQPLQDDIKDGQLGSFKVDPESLKNIYGKDGRSQQILIVLKCSRLYFKINF